MPMYGDDSRLSNMALSRISVLHVSLVGDSSSVGIPPDDDYLRKQYMTTFPPSFDRLIADLRDALLEAERMQAASAALPGAKLPPPVTCYSQRNPTWVGDRMGTGTGTVGEFGCWITAGASIVSDAAGQAFTPKQMNDWLQAHGGYQNGAYLVAADMICKPLPGVIRFVERVNCPTVPAPLQKMRDWLDGGGYLIVVVKVATTDGTHFVRVTDVDVTGDSCEIMDSWDGTLATIPPKYHEKSAKYIIQAALFYAKA